MGYLALINQAFVKFIVITCWPDLQNKITDLRPDSFVRVCLFFTNTFSDFDKITTSYTGKLPDLCRLGILKGVNNYMYYQDCEVNNWRTTRIIVEYHNKRSLVGPFDFSYVFHHAI